MPSTYRVRYPEFRGAKRPYLSLDVTGPNGVGMTVDGIVDSGADFSCMPVATARLLGYTRATLRERDIAQASGVVEALQATVPIRAFVHGLSSVEIELKPVFIRGGHTLWGRADFFHAFQAVGFLERAQELMLTFGRAT